MKLNLITLEGIVLDTDVYEVILPTAEGEIAVFPSHEPLVTLAVPGAIAVRYKEADADSKLDFFAISGGVIQISQKLVKVLVDEADRGDDIVENEVQAALERAIQLRDSADSQMDLDKAHQMVDRHQVRLKVAELRRRHHR